MIAKKRILKLGVRATGCQSAELGHELLQLGMRERGKDLTWVMEGGVIRGMGGSERLGVSDSALLIFGVQQDAKARSWDTSEARDMPAGFWFEC